MFKFEPIKADQTYAIRHMVLWPNEPTEYCMLAEDHDAFHFGGYVDKQLVSVASLFPDGPDKVRLRKFAIIPEMQKQGLGSRMLQEMQAFLSTSDFSAMWCDARLNAADFYVKNGFVTYGDVFHKNGVVYVKAEYKVPAQSDLG